MSYQDSFLVKNGVETPDLYAQINYILLITLNNKNGTNNALIFQSNFFYSLEVWAMKAEFAKFKYHKNGKLSPSIPDSYAYELKLKMQIPNWLNHDGKKKHQAYAENLVNSA